MKIRRRVTIAKRRNERRDPHMCRPAFETLESRRMLAGSVLQLELSDAPAVLSGAPATDTVGDSVYPLTSSDFESEGEADQPPTRQPIVLLPGILGSLPEEQFASWLVFDNEALQPENLEVDPIKRTYDDLIASLIAAGYNDGAQPGMQTLWVAPYDWRLPVAPRDGITDGNVETEQLDPTDTEWEFGIEYLYHWIDRARTEWEAWNLDPSLFAVDVVAHSMGGLVARSYIQSDLFRTGEIDQLLMLGTPNHGAVDAYQIRDWIDLSLDLMPELALERVADRLTETGPVRAMAGTILVAGANVLNSPTVEDYSPSITDLMPTFDFISNVWPHKWVRGIDDNTLLADLNSSYDYAAQGVDAKVLFGTGLETDYELYHPLGAELLNVWAYDDLPTGSGDGTVLAASAQLPGVAHEALDRVVHVEMAGADVRVQQEVFEFLGISAPADGYKTGAFRSLAAGIADWGSHDREMIFAGSDPVEFVNRHWPEFSEEYTLIARLDSYAAVENESLVVEATLGILANDRGGQVLTVQLEQRPSHGELVLRFDGSFTYRPDRGFNREDSFVYRVTDDLGNSRLASVVITVATKYPWHNGARPADVNADDHVSPVDALAVITTLNIQGGRELFGDHVRPLAAPFYDVNRDGAVSPIDALIVISHLNAGTASEVEGESGMGAPSPLAVVELGNAALVTIADSATPRRHVRWQRGEEKAELVAVRTGRPQAEPHQRARLAKDTFVLRRDTDLEEILSDITTELDHFWKGGWRRN